MRAKFRTESGRPHPMGATPDKTGVNFCVFSQNATSIELLIFEKSDSLEPMASFVLDPFKNKTYNFWHIFVHGLKPGCFYVYKVDGPFDLQNGHRFNKRKALIDPYSKGIDESLWKREDSLGGDDNTKTSLRSAIIDTTQYNWFGDKPLNRPLSETIVYEMHVGHLTKSPTSKCKYPGKFYGVIEKIPYLKSLGITAVELMPVFDFDSGDPKNVWGYGSAGFFAPESRYCTTPNKASHVRDFRDMVRALHRAGIEVILDVVFGYTVEGDAAGPTLCFRGFDNSIYYQLSSENKEFYMNFSGCGNTLNANHPIVAKFIIDCLEYWVTEMHVDGFRFDEASLMSRDENGAIMSYPHVLWNIDLSEKLLNTKIFAEPWDAGGAYLVGKFPGYRFVEWNGRFRDDMRKFVRGEKGIVPTIASRITGSADLYQWTNRAPLNSLNFITSHDGFTLYDNVSYNDKHNEENNENNQDGINDNFSYNHGAEGETDNLDIVRIRQRQIKNFATLLLLSKGVPMILMGDEVGRTQGGNNNAYCLDNEKTWFNWDLVKKNREQLMFYQRVIEFRKRFKFFSEVEDFAKVNKDGEAEIKFHGCKIDAPGWDNSDSRVLSYSIRGKIHIMINMDDKGLMFEVPDYKNKKWYVAINTGLSGVGAYSSGSEPKLPKQDSIYLENKSIVVLISK